MVTNKAHYLAFDKDWFRKNQRRLLWLLNNRFTKRWFRRVMRITQEDLPLQKKVAAIAPNRFYYDLEGNQITVSFRTHEKYAKRLYFAFKPLWWVIHFWDWLIADRFVPRWSYGFLTLTAFPASGTAGTTGDGYVFRSIAGSETLATIRAGAGTGTDTGTLLSPLLTASSTSNQFNFLARAILTFDTSSLTSSASISSATLSLFGNAKSNGLGSPDIHAAGATPSVNTNFANSDYGQCGTTSYGSVAYASISTIAYNGITLNASGISNISLTGISKFSAQLSWDVNNSFTGVWSSGQTSELDFQAADVAGTSNDPKLDITYTLVSASSMLTLLGVS